MLRPLLPAAALVLLVGDVCLYGVWTNRWTPSRELSDAAARLAEVPNEVGTWRGKDLELSDREVKAAEIAGYLYRTYEDRRTSAAVTVLLLCGRSGPVSVHPPDVCYRGAGYEPVGPQTRPTVDLLAGGEASFQAARFRKQGQAGLSRLRIYWAWNAGGDRWVAPDNPRLAFAGRPALFKLYLVRQMTSSNPRLEDETCIDFLRLFVPVLDRALFPPRTPT
jgi:hypothetical protein